MCRIVSLTLRRINDINVHSPGSPLDRRGNLKVAHQYTDTQFGESFIFVWWTVLLKSLYIR